MAIQHSISSLAKSVAATDLNAVQLRSRFLGLRFDHLSAAEVLLCIGDADRSSFSFVVTPNVLHVVRASRNAALADALSDASWSLCDSQIIRALFRLGGNGSLPLVRGSDLTAALLVRLGEQSGAEHTLGVIGCEPEQIESLEQQFRIKVTAHYNPPMGFIDMRGEIGKALAYMAGQSVDIWLLALGVPQQELLAHAARGNGKITGIGLCIGASVDYLSGREQRAPAWLANAGLEWLWRLLRDPRGKWRRYLLEAPRVFVMFVRNPKASDASQKWQA